MTKLLPVSGLGVSDQELVRAALKARERAYAPYSSFFVGCALRDVDGSIHVGCNVENASYSATICAERSAMVSMVSQGGRSFSVLVVTTSSEDPCFPCGVCLQVIQELASKARIVAVDRDGKNYFESFLSELFPSAFSREKLKT